MNSLLKNPTHVAQIGYNGFNMEHTVDFSSAPFMLLPIYFDWLNPGDKVSCNAFAKVRTMPLAAPAEFSSTVRLDWFAVPVEQIFKYFGDLYYNISDFSSDFIPDDNIDQRSFCDRMPYVGLNQLSDHWKQMYNDIADSIFEDVDDVIIPTIKNSASLQLLKVTNYLRLMDALIVSSTGVLDPQPIGSTNPLLFCAYQKIYMDFYRLSDREVNYPSSYNLDSFALKPGNTVNINGNTFLNRFCELRYAPYKKDFFTNLFVSPLQGSADIGSAGRNAQQFNNWLSGNVFVTSQPFSSVPQNVSPTTVVASRSDSSRLDASALQSQVNVSNLHAMFAMEKALEITRRAGKHYDAQTLAHWGIEVPQGLAGEVIYLGSQTQPFVVGQVTSTAASGDEPLGTLAGQGYSDPHLSKAINEPITFQAKGHTILMCIYSVIPEVKYTQRGMDKINGYLEWSDFLHPEFDDLGMQPMFRYQQLESFSQDYSDVVGWQYPFSELKLKYNRVFGGVHTDGSLHYWVPQRDLKDYDSNYISKLNFMGLPTYLNDILVQPYALIPLMENNTTPHFDTLKENWYSILYMQDPFINSVDFSVIKSSKMSKYGLVNL